MPCPICFLVKWDKVSRGVLRRIWKYTDPQQSSQQNPKRKFLIQKTSGEERRMTPDSRHHILLILSNSGRFMPKRDEPRMIPCAPLKHHITLLKYCTSDGRSSPIVRRGYCTEALLACCILYFPERDGLPQRILRTAPICLTSLSCLSRPSCTHESQHQLSPKLHLPGAIAHL